MPLFHRKFVSVLRTLTTRMRLLAESAMYRFPPPSIATSLGWASVAASAGPLSPEKLPAPVVGTPARGQVAIGIHHINAVVPGIQDVGFHKTE